MRSSRRECAKVQYSDRLAMARRLCFLLRYFEEAANIKISQYVCLCVLVCMREYLSTCMCERVHLCVRSSQREYAKELCNHRWFYHMREEASNKLVNLSASVCACVLMCVRVCICASCVSN